MIISESNIKISNRIPSLFTERVNESYPDFINFIQEYYKADENLFGSSDLLNQLVNYFNIGNTKIFSLVESTKLSTNINDIVTTITVESTKGFPNAGFIKINDEYVYYDSKTDTQFLNCRRGATAAELNNGLISYSPSISKTHTTNSVVTDLAYPLSEYISGTFAYQYLSNLPKKLNENVNYNLLIKNIKQFYKSAGTEDSIKFLFKIVYNDTSTHLKIAEGGSGAKIGVIVSGGIITSAVVINGGTGYATTPYFPNIQIVGKGSGAKLAVTSVVGGVITGVSVVNGGRSYNNINSILVSDRDFTVNDTLYGVTSRATGVITYWNPDTRELYVDKVVGVFSANEVIHDSYATGIVDSTDIVTREPMVTRPYENTIKTSDYTPKLSELLFELTQPVLDLTTVNNFNILQDAPGLANITAPIAEINYYSPTLIRVVVDQTNQFYLPPTTKIVSLVNNRIIVDSTVGFLTAGIIKIGTEYVSYTNKNINEFLGLTRNISISGSIPHTIVIGNKVQLYGGYKNNVVYNFNCTIYNDRIKAYGRLIGVLNNPVVVSGGSGYKPSIFRGIYQKTYKDAIDREWNGVSQLYDADDMAYITSNGKPIPNAFNTNVRTYNEQVMIKRIPKANFNVGDDTTSKGIGVTIDGVEICNYSGNVINYGKITKLSLTNFGNNYKLPNNVNDIYPYVRINSVNFNNLIKIYGGITKVSLGNIPTSKLTNFYRKPVITIERGVGDVTGVGAELECDYDVTGVINGVLVKNPGKWYTEIPIITITEGGKFIEPYIIPPENITVLGFIGKSQYTPTQSTDPNFDPKNFTDLDIIDNTIYTNIPTANIPTGSSASISLTTINGVISSVVVENAGNDYYTAPNIILLNTNGSGAIFSVVVRFGKIISVSIIDGGRGYNNPTVSIVNSGDNAQVSCQIETWHKDVVFNNPYMDDDGGYVYNHGDPNLSTEHIPDTNNYPQYLQYKYVDRNVYGDIFIDAYPTNASTPYYFHNVTPEQYDYVVSTLCATPTQVLSGERFVPDAGTAIFNLLGVVINNPYLPVNLPSVTMIQILN